jgi:hypothetical protein
VSSSAPAERAARPRLLATPVVGAVAALLGGLSWKFALVVTLLGSPAVLSTLLRGLTGLGLDAALAIGVLLLGQRLPRAATLLGLGIGVTGALDVYPAIVLGGPVTSRLLPYASSLRPGLLHPGLVALTVVVVVVVVVVAGAARGLDMRRLRSVLLGLVVLAVGGLVVEGVSGSGEGRARLGLDRHHALLLLPLPSSLTSSAHDVGAGVVVDPGAIDPETPVRSAPIMREPAEPPRHVVFVILESIAARHVDPTTMPRLLELGGDHAVWFDDHVAESPVSIKALFSLLCGLPPLPSRDLESAALPRLDCRSLPEVLVDDAGGGFDAGFFHGGYFAFTDKLAFLTERGFSALVDGENLPARAQRVWKNGWGADDRVVVEESLRWLDGGLAAGRRTLNVVVPLIPHHEYFLPPDAPKPFGSRSVVDRYRNGLRFADDVLGRLIDGYRARGLLDDTLFVVVGDHGEAFDEHPGNRLHGSFLYEENLRTPLLIRAASLPAGAQRSLRPSTHADVAPTILSMLGMPPPDRPGALDEIAGRDLLADTFVPRPTAHFTSFPTALWAVRGARWKAIASDDGRVAELYDLAVDPHEQQPLDDVRARSSLLAWGRTTLNRRAQVLMSAPRLGPTWLERAASSSSLPLSPQRVFNMVRPCIPLSTSSQAPTTLVFKDLAPPARFVGVGVIDDSRFKKQGGLQVAIGGDDGVRTDIVVTDRFEDSSRVVAIAPSHRVTITAAPSPQQARGCIWLSP